MLSDQMIVADTEGPLAIPVIRGQIELVTLSNMESYTTP